MTRQTQDTAATQDVMSPAEFAILGGGEVAYVKKVMAEDVQRLFPGIMGLPEGIPLFAVHAADGTPIALTDSQAAALANVMEHDLQPVSVH